MISLIVFFKAQKDHLCLNTGRLFIKRKEKHCKLVSNQATETKNKKRIHARVSKNNKKNCE